MVARTGRRWIGRVGVGLLLGVSAPAGAARAGDPPADTQKAATAAATAFSAFRDGARAFERGEFLRAAAAFETAYQLAPHPDALWNAARAWDRAGEPARAANRYAKYLREAPPDAPDRDDANRALADLSRKLGRIDVVAPGARDIAVDEKPADGERVYVVPGKHVVQGRAGDQQLLSTVEVAAGAAVSVALTAEPKAPATTTTPPSTTTVYVVPAETPRLSRPPFLRRPALIALVTGVTATAVSTGLAVASAVDTQAARRRFDAERTPQDLLDGQARQARTNALVGVTAGLGALTIAATLLLGDWKRAPARVSLTVGADGTLTLRGAL